MHKHLTSTQTDMNNDTNTQHEESTYALLVRSQEEERSLPETGVYLLLILTMAFAVGQMAQQRFQLPSIGLLQGTPIVQMAEKPDPSV